MSWFEDECWSFVKVSTDRMGSAKRVLVSSGIDSEIMVEDELANLLRNPGLNQELVFSSLPSEKSDMIIKSGSLICSLEVYVGVSPRGQ